MFPMLPDTLGTAAFMKAANLVKMSDGKPFIDLINSARQDSGSLSDFLALMVLGNYKGAKKHMPEGTELKPADLKKPMNFLKKFGFGLLNGVGGISQGALSTAMVKFIPNADLSAFLQWLGFSIANGAIDNEYLTAAVAGGAASSAKELVMGLWKKYGMSIKGVPGQPGIGTTSKIVQSGAPAAPNEDFF